jgi:hypothetical protein
MATREGGSCQERRGLQRGIALDKFATLLERDMGRDKARNRFLYYFIAFVMFLFMVWKCGLIFGVERLLE